MEGLSWIGEAVSGVIGLGGILAAIYIAIRYGDVRAAHEMMEFEEKKSARAQRVALRTLIAATRRIEEMAKYNVKVAKTSLWQTRVPIAPLENAFLSAQTSLLGGPADSIIESSCFPLAIQFLCAAHVVNLSIDQSLSREAPGTSQIGIRDDTPDGIAAGMQVLEESLERLVKALEGALATASP